MKENRIRQKWVSGQATIGCFLGLGSPHLAELLARLGFDWLVIETEHSGLDSTQVERMLMDRGQFYCASPSRLSDA